MPTYPVPRSVRDIAANAIKQNQSLPLAQRAAYKEQGKTKVEGTGMRTARRLVSGRVSAQQLYLMRAWFARHSKAVGSKEARRDKTSRASIAWRLWGGSGAQAWINSTIRTIEREEKQKKK
jgi:hypothetical protein